MGWKSTIEVTREEALNAIINKIIKSSNQELEEALMSLNFGDDINLPWYGYNFIVSNHFKSDEDE